MPVPPIDKQLELAHRFMELLKSAKKLAAEAQQLERDAKALIITELLGEGDSE